MLGFIKKCFLTGLACLSTLTNINFLSCISMNNQECKVRPQIVNVNNEGPLFFPFSIKTVVVAIISIIHMQNCVFVIMKKT